MNQNLTTLEMPFKDIVICLVFSYTLNPITIGFSCF